MNDNTLDETGRMTTVSIAIEQERVDELDAEAVRQDRSRSWIVRQAISDYLAARAARTDEGQRHA